MKFLLAGLCLAGNRGGPALALSLIDAWHRVRPDIDVTLVVPGGLQYADEQRWAAQFGIKIVADIETHQVGRPMLSSPLRGRALALWKAYRATDAVVDMSGVAYVGPPIRTPRDMLRERRVRHRALALLHRRPFLAWTQSYGPLTDKTAQRIAAQDLGRLPVVFCRGARSAEAVRLACPGAVCREYPDVAIALATDQTEADRWLAVHNVTAGFLSVTPSAVMYNQAGGAGGDVYIDALAQVATAHQAAGGSVLFVPHTRYPDGSAPSLCDLAVSRLVAERTAKLAGRAPVVFEDDVGPRVLKGLLSRASAHVGSRYHALVASLSSGVPSLALAWHDKYEDLMTQFGVAQRLVPPGDADGKVWVDAMQSLWAGRAADAQAITTQRGPLTRLVEKNALEFVRVLEGML